MELPNGGFARKQLGESGAAFRADRISPQVPDSTRLPTASTSGLPRRRLRITRRDLATLRHRLPNLGANSPGNTGHDREATTQVYRGGRHRMVRDHDEPAGRRD